MPAESTAIGVSSLARTCSSAGQSSGFLNRRSRDRSPPSPREKTRHLLRHDILRDRLAAGQATLTRSTVVRIHLPELLNPSQAGLIYDNLTGLDPGTGRRVSAGGVEVEATRKGAGNVPPPRGARLSPEERRRRSEEHLLGGPPSLVWLRSSMEEHIPVQDKTRVRSPSEPPALRGTQAARESTVNALAAGSNPALAAAE